jgi:predicted ABC-type ATPase
MKPVLLVIAGPNGAGKTTLTERLRKDRWSEGVEYLNPDEIARDRFGDWNSPEAVKKAADWTAARREELLANRAGIAFETVFSTHDKVDFLERVRDADYFIRVFFVSTRDPRINAARVANRVIKGGHTVPIEKIVSRYQRSMINLGLAIQLADRVYIYDNSVDDADAALCARTEDAHLRKVYTTLPDWVAAAVAELPRHAAFT